MNPHPSSFIPPADIPDAGLREILKHCSLPTYDAARAYRRTGHPRYLRSVVRGILERQVARDLLPILNDGGRGDSPDRRPGPGFPGPDRIRHGGGRRDRIPARNGRIAPSQDG